MEAFLQESGLENSIDTILCKISHSQDSILAILIWIIRSADHELDIEQLNELNDEQVKELFPKLGERLRFKNAVKKRFKTDDDGPKRKKHKAATQETVVRLFLLQK